MKPHITSTLIASLGGLFLCPPAGAQDSATPIDSGSNPAPPAVLLHSSIIEDVLVPLNATLNTGSSNLGSPFTEVDSPPLNLGGFNIVINAGTTLAANASALAAFQAAAQLWKQYISDPITVTIDADLDSTLASNVIGSAGSVVLSSTYASLRDQMVADSAGETDDAIVSHLPAAGAFTAFVPGNTTLTSNLLGTKANLKALGFTGLDTQWGATDATIKFNSNFAFDFDSSNGVGSGLMDFKTVAAHEIGHSLGFISAVDQVNAGATSISPFLLDLFRFRDTADLNPSSIANFEEYERDLVPGSASFQAVFDDLGIEYKLSTGSGTSFPGTDGNQASHWKADELTTQFIGLMDPTLSYGQFYGPTVADLRALDLIGYEINFSTVPEVSNLAAGLLLLLGAARRRRPPPGR